MKKTKLTVKEIIFCGMFAALIAVGAFLRIDIPLPVYTMHFTLQWFFVLMAGFLLGAKLGALSVIIYLLVGLAGVPVFAAGGGPGYIFRPGFGFLLGFVLAAFLIGFFSEKFHAVKPMRMLIPATIGLVVYYGTGAVYFYLIKNLYAGQAITFAVVVVQYCLITVPPDFVLCILACLLSARLRRPFEQMMVR